MRRKFKLPSFDMTYLTTTNFEWETISQAQEKWLLIHDYPIPKGYCVEHVVVALEIFPGYPYTQIDMVYFYPALARTDGQRIGATQVNRTIDGRSFQRWSRHRTSDAPWRPGEDDIASHLVLVDDWLEREFKIR